MILLVTGCFGSLNIRAQTGSDDYFTPGGIFDTIYDRFGAKIPLRDLMITAPNGWPGTTYATPSPTCDAGYFRLHFEANSTLDPNHYSVLCQLFTDLSCFIQSPLSSPCSVTSNTTKVHIYITDDATGGTAGSASYMLSFPSNPSSNTPGISDNLVWKTIVSGVDGYIGVAPPMNIGNNFYHAIINVNTTVNWNYNLSTASLAPGQYDFYTVYLHEATHALGFASQFGPGGTSLYGANNNYFSRFDMFLRDHNSVPLLNNTTPSCVNNSMQFIGGINNNINPGGCLGNSVSGWANCATSVQYVSPSNTVPVPIYTPFCFEIGSSMSHFEDICYPTAAAPYGNNQYFIMAEAYGGVKRHLKEEERNVLCDIGYSVSASYSTPAVTGNYTYAAGSCNGLSVWGVNDGIQNNTYSYIMTSNVITIPKAALLSNDSPNSTSVSCVSMVYNIAGLNLTETTTDISLAFAPGPYSFCGVAMIKYIPKNALGESGNLTYVYVYVPCTGCNPPNLCNYIQNQGFESGQGCGNLTPNTTPCWSSFNSVDLFDRNCFTSLSYPSQPFLNQFGINESHNGAPNNRFVGMQSGMGPPGTPYMSEVIQNHLSAPLTPGTTYVLSFWAVNRGVQMSAPAKPVIVTFATSPSLVVQVNQPVFPAGLNPIVTHTLPLHHADNNWHYYSIPFTFSSPGNLNHNYLILGPDPVLSSQLNGFNSGNIYIFIDDISILPIGMVPTFTPPATVCQGDILDNFGQYVNASGDFYGPGIQYNGGTDWELNSATVSPGFHSYAFVQTNTLTSCSYTTYAQIQVLARPTVTIVASAPSSLCLVAGESTTLTGMGAGNLSYTWSPPNNIHTASLAVTPPVTTTYSLELSDGFCNNSQTVTVHVIPPITFTNVPAAWCTGTQFFYLEDLLAPGSPTGTGGSWSATPSLPITMVNATSHQIYIGPGIPPGTYSLSYLYTTAPGCSLSAQFTTDILMTPTVSTNGPLYHCTNIPGYASTLIATSTSTLPMGYTWNPGNLSGASVTVIPTNTNMVTDYSVVATDGTCTSQPAILVMGTSSLCCGTATSATAFNYLNTSVSNTTLSGLYAINQNLTIQGNVTLDGEFYIAPHVSITVGPMASLHTRGGYVELSGAPYNHHAHLLSCYDMWEGIYVDHLGQVEFEEGDLIEDARVAITSKGSQNPNTNPISYDIILNDVVFNRNDVGVAIKDFTLSTGASPFEIRHCVFTSRDLPFTTQVNITGKPSWPDAATLRTITNFTDPMAPPSDLGGYPPLNLKTPYQNHPPTAGVLVENSGITQGPTAANPTYHAIIIGSTQYDGSGVNIFDNLSAGIFSKNSNVSSFGNVFQNTRNSNSLLLYGAGIRALNNETNPLNYNSYLNLVTPINASTNPNYFYDCHVGIDLNRVFQANVQYAEMRSTRDVQNPSSLLRGVYGMFIKGNRFKNYAIQNNQFLNLNFGVLLETDQGPFDLGSGQSGYGQVWGTVNIRYNLFSSAATSGASPGNGSMNIGVYAHNILYTKGSGPLGAGYYTVTPNNGLRIQENDFDQVYRGVYVRNFSNSLFGKFTANNRIRLVQDQIAPAPSPQWGVNYENNYFGVVNTNTVTGFSPLASASLSGVYFAMNNNSSAQCNSVVTLSKGMEFAGLNFGAMWRTNIFLNNARGLQLSSNGIIGQQGVFNNPSDNVWFGSTWVGANYNTWTDMTSFAANSPIYRRTLTGYDPLNNNGVLSPNSYLGTGNLINANNSAPYPPCVPGLLPSKGPNTSKSQLAGNISANNISYQGNYPGETEEINHLLLFRELEEDDTLRLSNAGIQTFYDGGYYAEAGTLMQIEQSLSEGNFSSAAALLASFSPTSAIQTNYQLFYELYLKFSDPLGTGLDAAEANALAALAQKCPFIDGAVIYQARSLLQRATGEPVFYNDEGCDITEDHFMEQELLERKAASPYLLAGEHSESYQLFPNPATDRVYVISPRQEEALRIQIRDLSDKLLAEETIQVRNFQAELKLNLINGLYFVTLVNQDHEQVVKKLVISK
jgi:hypothetical protein